MNRSVVLLIVIAALGLGGYLYWDGVQKTPRFVTDGTVIHALPEGADPGILTAEGFDKDKIMALLDTLPEELSTDLKGTLEASITDPTLRDAALEKIRAAYGL